MKRFLLFVPLITGFASSYAQHAPGYVDSTYEVQTYDATSSNWTPVSKVFYYYHQADSLYYNSVTKVWDTATLAYDINQTQDLLTYTSLHKIQSDVQQSWITSQSVWRNATQMLYTYDNNNNLTNLTNQSWDTLGNVWVNTSQQLNTYDINNNDTQSQVQIWKTSTSTWQDRFLQTSTFNGQNRVTQLVYQNRDTVNNVWRNDQQYIYQYPAADTIYTFHQFWDTTNNVWNNFSKDVYALNGYQNYKYDFTLQWNAVTSVFDSTTDGTYTYNTNNQLVSWIVKPVTGFTGNATDYIYDAAGNETQSVYQYDLYSLGIIFSRIYLLKLIYNWERVTSTLPVTLVDFIGSPVANTSQLQWHTATEINSSHFEVQHSLDGNRFDSIGNVAASGTAYLTNAYAFTDNAPTMNAVNYYRLKQVDKDGHFVYSKIIGIIFNDKLLVQVYPNPVHSNIFVKLRSAPSENYHINLTDISGKLISSQTYVSTGETHIINISLNNYSPGIYFLELRDVFNKIIAQQEIIKQ